jgi:tRNA(fMet)-specific endonuclease VapC
VIETALLDTDVASFLFKKSPRAKPFRPLIRGKRLALAVVSVAELFKWTLKRRWGSQTQGGSHLRGRCWANEVDRSLKREVARPKCARPVRDRFASC